MQADSCKSKCLTVWKNEKFGLTEKIFRQINSLVICLVKPLLSRNFCQKIVRLKFYNFHTVPQSKNTMWNVQESTFFTSIRRF